MTINIYQSELLGENILENLKEFLSINKYVIQFNFPKTNKLLLVNDHKNNVEGEKDRTQQLIQEIKKIESTLDSKWYFEDEITIEPQIRPLLFKVEAVQELSPQLFKNTLNYRLFVELIKEVPGLDSKFLPKDQLLADIQTGVIYKMIKNFCLEQLKPLDDTTQLKSSSQQVFKKLAKSFSECQKIREKEGICKKDYIIFLTEEAPIEKELFYLIDPSFDNNIIINVKALQALEICNPDALIAFFIAKSILCKSMFSTFTSWYLSHHPVDNRCVMHYSNDLNKLMNMLSHGDICSECENYLRKQLISHQEIRVLLNIIGKSSEKLKRRTFFQADLSPLPIIIKNYALDIFLKQTDGTLSKIDLPPSERALFILFLSFENGLNAKELHQKKDILLAIYSRMSNKDEKSDIQSTIDRITNHKNGAFNGLFSSKISKIKSQFYTFFDQDAEIANQYIIQGEKGEMRKILLNRTLVATSENIPFIDSIRKYFVLTEKDIFTNKNKVIPKTFNHLGEKSYSECRSESFIRNNNYSITFNFIKDDWLEYEKPTYLLDLQNFALNIMSLDNIKLLPAPKEKKEPSQACEDFKTSEKEEIFVPNKEKKLHDSTDFQKHE